MSVIVLHLSDIHVRYESDLVLLRANDIAKALYAKLPNASQVFVVVSGDVAFSGQSNEYDLALSFCLKISEFIKAEVCVPVEFIIVPGNHDCNFNKDTSARNLIIDGLLQKDLESFTINDQSVFENCTAIQGEFFEFREAMEGQIESSFTRMWKTRRFDVDGKTIVFDCLNVSWVSKLREAQGGLFFPMHLLENRQDNTVDLRCIVMHHPFNWFSQGMYRKFRGGIRKLANMIITGHEHVGNVGLIHEAESESSVFVEGGVLQEDGRDATSSFNVILIDLDMRQFSSTKFEWKGNMYIAVEEGSWINYHDLPSKRFNRFPLNAEFQKILDDPGAYFMHADNGSILLSDIFVYPDMIKVTGEASNKQERVNSKGLLDPDITAKCILIEGEEKSGCTSLLYQIYLEYHNRAFVPVFIRGEDIKGFSDREIESLIIKKCEQQYIEIKPQEFWQLSRNKRILLLDGIDRIHCQSIERQEKILSCLQKWFAHVVVIAGSGFEFKRLVDHSANGFLQISERYRLQEFGYLLRNKLIRKWHLLDAEVRDNSDLLLAKVDQSERLVDEVMQRGIVPSVPFFIIAMLQTIDSGRMGEFNSSGLGYCYQQILTESFQKARIKADKLTEYFNYASCLAWEFHKKQQKELSWRDLKNFNEEYSRKWHSVEFESRLNDLLEARILLKSGNDYSFRYPYIFYFLKGMYLKENLSEENKEYVVQCCQHLYVRDHANTVLFLAHHTNDDFVLESIVGSLRGLFNDRAPVVFANDVCAVNKLIESAPRLFYEGGEPESHRERANKFADAIDDGGDGLATQEETGENLSLVAKVTMLNKTTEILGQVLKNQYPRITRERKKQLIKELFDGPLRAIQEFYCYFQNNPDAFVAEIDAAIKRRGNVSEENIRKNLARKLAAAIIQVLTFAILMRAAKTANSDSLVEDIEGAVEDVGTPAFKLIELAMLLDSPKPIPRIKIKSLLRMISGTLIGERVVNLMILNRLYMFRTSERDMQWIFSELNINLERQHSISYQEQRMKKLNK